MDLTKNISVLMAVHNGEKARNLHKALCSLNNQSLQPKQIVLVEDGPLGGQLMDEIEHWQSVWGRRLTIVRNAENLGLTASLNRGIEQVCNPIIARMDSDDIAHPRRFERQARFLRQHPDIDIVGGSIKEFNDEGRNLATRHYPLTHNAVLHSIHRASPLAHPAVMMRSTIFQRGLRYDERYRTSQDIALWFDAICAGFRIANIPDTVLYFRQDDRMYRRRGRGKAWGEFAIYCSGIRRLYGVISWRYLFPVGRLMARMMPSAIIRWLYRSGLRRMVVE